MESLRESLREMEGSRDTNNRNNLFANKAKMYLTKDNNMPEDLGGEEVEASLEQH